MSIKELSDEFIPDKTGLHKVWEITIKDTRTLLKRYGSFCLWNKLVLERDSKGVYRIEIKQNYTKNWDKGVRKEFFSEKNRASRRYIGDQFSFIEFIEVADKLQSIPPQNALVFSLEKRIYDLYSKKAREIFNLKG